MTTIAVIGAGSWGTAIAIHLARNGHHILLWDRDAAKLQAMAANRFNPKYLQHIPLPETIRITFDLQEAVTQSTFVFIAVPSHGFRDCLQTIKPYLKSDTGVCWGSKGFEKGTVLHYVAEEVMGLMHPLAVMSGPSFAEEVAAGMPTAITVASTQPKFAEEICQIFHSITFRPYVSKDIIGVEIGGVVKNVLAIAAGIADGLGYGANTRCALITRGLAELVRFGVKLGGTQETFYGLAGVGDLILTATDDKSRNRRFGLAIGSGATVQEALQQIGQVVEGVRNAEQVFHTAQTLNIDMPITEQVYRVIYENLSPQDAVNYLFSRTLTSE